MTSVQNYKNQQRTRINYRHIKWTRNILLSIVFFGVVSIAIFAWSTSLVLLLHKMFPDFALVDVGVNKNAIQNSSKA